ncbi:hypothetical protein QTA56_07465 [Acinetobacter sp. VNH17]|uniref:Uncharacterized protein n=1 Tax=Acinetobacter thutiue TaxID=2998078 RepID=A0ABT7WNC0_9GAMM|nr:hypothetical protein [Acinetobacter thutiue]MCY6411970.1 hypothetical protein [Acinetobacter thutiue]MDN0014074.1 hypothetical protein [Acinetobacter thutiue]
MSKGFKFSILAIIGLILFVIGVGSLYKPSVKKESDSIDKNIAQNEQYEKSLEQAAIAMHESKLEAKQKELNPPINASLSIEQTKDFIHRVEQLKSTDTQVNLEYLPDVAAQSRKYNALIDEAEKLYGVIDISNPYRYCTSMANYARALWELKYSKATESKESLDNTRKTFQASYIDAQKGCLEDIQAAGK